MAEPVQSESQIEVTEKDLPLHCPMPRTPVWCYHPRVYLKVAGGAGQSRCPYCGTMYVYKGAPPKGH
jgi:uncharacterized Zn-finger protein